MAKTPREMELRKNLPISGGRRDIVATPQAVVTLSQSLKLSRHFRDALEHHDDVATAEPVATSSRPLYWSRSQPRGVPVQSSQETPQNRYKHMHTGEASMGNAGESL
ncbi:hypothetical protein Taro_011474 [Colocasia esculenta]|uniref:Uncharacterized protein n=1 Tax=Colocasia esculenta TaxID=4460 RepID=A0A843UB20_COLES|nr:hypothetical protein [Colocasia esculenta]